MTNTTERWENHIVAEAQRKLKLAYATVDELSEELAKVRGQLDAAEDHIAGLCKELDSRAPGWENEPLWYARAASNQDRSQP